MAISKKYRQGAEDVGKLAGKALDHVAERIEKGTRKLERAVSRQVEINNAVFDMLDEDAARLTILEIGYKPIDMRMVYAFSPEIKAGIARVISDIPCSYKTQRYQMLLLARLGITPLPANKRIDLSGDAAAATATMLFKLSAVDDSENAQEAIENALDSLNISRTELKRIAGQISELSEMMADSFGEFIIRELDDPESFTNPIIKPSKVKHKIKGILVGKAGSGKYTLLQGIFEYENAPKLSKTIEGTEFTLFSDESGQVALYNTPGFELGDQTALVNNIHELVKSESINVLLYCVNDASRRFEAFEADLVRSIRNLNSNLAVYVALTNCIQPDGDDTKELIQYISSQTNHTRVIPVLEKKKTIANVTIEPHGIRELIEVIAYE